MLTRIFLILSFVIGTLQVNSQTCYITKTGSKYHTATCSYLKYSKYSVDLDKAINHGYTACSRCRPSRSNLKGSTSSQGFYQSTQSASSRQLKCTTKQCSGKTQKGYRCKRRTKDCSGRCYHHRN